MKTESRMILLVEDDPNDEPLSLRALKMSSIKNDVNVVRDGEEALDFLFCRNTYELEKLEHLPASSSDFPSKPAEILIQDLPSRRVILLADDNIPNILTIGEYLEAHGYNVVTAHDGLEAVEKAEALHPDLILMDIQMPSMNGWEAIAYLRANPQFENTPIVALTALVMPGDRERSLLAGANEYMSKPVSLKTLRQVIENLLQN